MITSIVCARQYHLRNTLGSESRGSGLQERDAPRARLPSKPAGFDSTGLLTLDRSRLHQNHNPVPAKRQRLSPKVTGPTSKCPVLQYTGGQEQPPQVTTQSGQPVEACPPSHHSEQHTPARKDKEWLRGTGMSLIWSWAMTHFMFGSFQFLSESRSVNTEHPCSRSTNNKQVEEKN